MAAGVGVGSSSNSSNTKPISGLSGLWLRFDLVLDLGSGQSENASQYGAMILIDMFLD